MIFSVSPVILVRCVASRGVEQALQSLTEQIKNPVADTIPIYSYEMLCNDVIAFYPDLFNHYLKEHDCQHQYKQSHEMAYAGFAAHLLYVCVGFDVISVPSNQVYFYLWKYIQKNEVLHPLWML